MAATHRAAPDPRFPVGTVLSIHTGEHRRMAPGPAAVTTATVAANRTWTATGLAYDTRYTAAAEINGRWLTTLFTTSADPAANAPTGADITAISLAASGADTTGTLAADAFLIAALADSRPVDLGGPENTYLIEDEIELADNATITARGAVLKAKAGTSISVLVATGRAGIRLEGFTIDGNKDNVTGGNGIVLEGCTEFMVRGVWVKNAYNVGILIDADGTTACTDGTITGCRVSAPGGHGIALSGTAGDGTTSGPKRVAICGNVVTDAGQSAINASQSRSCSVTGNSVYRSGSTVTGFAGIRLSNGSTNCTVAGNSIDGTSRGVFIVADAGAGDGACSYNSVSGNTIRGCQQQAILCEGPYNSITGNTVRDCVQDGASLDGAIRVASASYCTVVGNTVVDTAGTKHEYGIEATGTADYCTVVGNVIEGWQTLPLSVTGAGSQVRGNATDLTVDRASGATLAVRDHSDYVNVTGTTGISAISANARVGREITLKFNGNLTVTNGATLKLAGGVNFSATADDLLTLVYDGTGWVEKSRSVN
jgi:hypothetical protein